MTPRTKSANGNGSAPTFLEPPSDLSLDSRERWPRFLADVAGTDDRGQACEVDALMLAELLRTCDRLAQVREQLSSDGMTVTGSQDQTRPHPLLGIERQLVAELAQGLERLRLTPARRPFGSATRPDGRLGRINFKTGLIA